MQIAARFSYEQYISTVELTEIMDRIVSQTVVVSGTIQYYQ